MSVVLRIFSIRNQTILKLRKCRKYFIGNDINKPPMNDHREQKLLKNYFLNYLR